jgi:DNA-binding NarL/FixJ family response regulator
MSKKEMIEKEVQSYHAKGLTSKEIGKLTGLSTRTVQRYLKEAKGNTPTAPLTPIQQKAIELHLQGWSYAEIARKLRVCKTSVYNWHKKVKK